MRLNLCLILIIVWQSRATNDTIFFPFNTIQSYENFTSNETHFTWILYPPWKYHTNLFNVNPEHHSTNYFSINQEDQITNQSYIETSRITACKNIHLTFSSKVSHASTEINLILFTYRSNTWNKTWEYMHKNSHWGLHQLSLNISETNEDIRFRYLPISSSSARISLDMTIPIISTNFNCTFNQSTSSLHRRNFSSIHLFIFIIFGSVFLLLFIAVMLAFIYGLVYKQYSRWIRKRSTRRPRKRKTTNVVGDESTVLGIETDTV